MNSNLNEWENDLISNLERGLKYGKSKGIDALELYLINSYSLDVKIKGEIIDVNQGGDIGVGCRSVKNNKIGFATASGIGDSSVDFAVDSALEISKVLKKGDDRWENFVTSEEKGKEGIIDESVFEYEGDDIFTTASSVYKEAKDYSSKVKSIEGMISIGYGAFAVGNSEGLSKSSKNTFCSTNIYVIAGEGDKTKNAMSSYIGRGVPKLQGLGSEAAEKAINFLEAEKLNQTGKSKVIFNNITAGYFLSVALTNSVNGKSVVEGTSKFADKINQKIGNDKLTIYDDGQIPEDPEMVAIDDEGYPRQRTCLIENGRLKNFIFNQYYSNVHNSKNTGNSKRRGTQSYEALPDIALNTVSVPPGKRSLDELILEVNDGILIEDLLLGMGHSNLISGDFSVVAPNCFKIKHGEIVKPLEPVSVAGNLYKAFNQIEMKGKEQELHQYGMVPSILFRDFTISG
jgi:PmbA protein